MNEPTATVSSTPEEQDGDPNTPVPTNTQLSEPTQTRTAATSATPAPAELAQGAVAKEALSFPGFQTVEVLPDDIFLPAADPADVIRTLSYIPQAGGAGLSGGRSDGSRREGECVGTIEPSMEVFGSRTASIFIRFCAVLPLEPIDIRLEGPDGSVFTDTIRTEGEYFFRFDPIEVLPPGRYEVSAAVDSFFETVSVETTYPDFSYVILSPGGTVTEGKPVEIIYVGFQPNENLQVLLYESEKVGTGPIRPTEYHFVRSWSASVSEDGRLVQHVESPQLPGEGQYTLFIIGESSGGGLIKEGSLENYNSSNWFDHAASVDFSASFSDNLDSFTTMQADSVSFDAGHLRRLIHVPAGDFEMGAGNGTPRSAEPIERPQHTVYVSEFWIEQTEVSNASYATCVQAGVCTPPLSVTSTLRSEYYNNPLYADYPVINVSHAQADEYCQWAGGRLPTEAEWERSARYPNLNYYVWSPEGRFDDLANYGDNVGDTTPVTHYALGATPLGLVNMHGNVWEWVGDWFDANYYSVSPARDPTGPATGSERVVRGGGWTTRIEFLSFTNRFHLSPIEGYSNVGFRCVTTEPSPPT